MSTLVAGVRGVCGRQNMSPPQYVHITIPVTREHATLNGERDFFRCDCIKDFELGRLFDFPNEPNLITSVLNSGDPFPAGVRGVAVPVEKRESAQLTVQVAEGTASQRVRAATGC